MAQVNVISGRRRGVGEDHASVLAAALPDPDLGWSLRTPGWPSASERSDLPRVDAEYVQMKTDDEGPRQPWEVGDDG